MTQQEIEQEERWLKEIIWYAAQWALNKPPGWITPVSKLPPLVWGRKRFGKRFDDAVEILLQRRKERKG